jgi:ATP-dependent Clp protease ATP-binding subunit ClpA
MKGYVASEREDPCFTSVHLHDISSKSTLYTVDNRLESVIINWINNTKNFNIISKSKISRIFNKKVQITDKNIKQEGTTVKVFKRLKKELHKVIK